MILLLFVTLLFLSHAIEELNLRNCSSLSDIALSYLRRLPNLQSLDLTGLARLTPEKLSDIIQRCEFIQ